MASHHPTRLFVGNLAPQVDEYTLAHVFSKFGTLAKLDVMYHKSGPQRGQPRGYAFVEYSRSEDASMALGKLHDRVLRGRRIVVTHANSSGEGSGRSVKVPKTALSLLKAKKVTSAEAQIAAMEAKLAAMSQRPDRSPTPERVAADALEAEVMGMAAAADAEGGAEAKLEVKAEAEVSGSGSGSGSRYAVAKPSLSPGRTSVSASASPRRDDTPSRRDYASPRRDRERGNSTPRSRSRSPVRRDSPRHHALPPRPDLPARPTSRPPPAPAPTPASAAPSALQRGLAGLPKKPTFTPSR